MKYHLNICPFYLIQMLCGRAQLFLTDPRNNPVVSDNRRSDIRDSTVMYFDTFKILCICKYYGKWRICSFNSIYSIIMYFDAFEIPYI